MDSNKPEVLETESYEIREQRNSKKVSEALHHDHVAQEAIGGQAQDLGASYWRSPKFLGTLVVSTAPYP